MNYTVELCHRSHVTAFIEKWHYSKNMNGVISDYCFKLMDGSTMIGAMVFGKIAMAGVWKKYAASEKELTELRRLCCIDDTPKNTESYFIGRALRWLKRNTAIKTVLSYADATYNHTGTIYRASNFEHKGMTSKGRMIKYGDRLYHDKTIRTKYKGELKPFALKIKQALENEEAKYIETKGKHIFLYQLIK